MSSSAGLAIVNEMRLMGHCKRLIFPSTEFQEFGYHEAMPLTLSKVASLSRASQVWPKT